MFRKIILLCLLLCLMGFPAYSQQVLPGMFLGNLPSANTATTTPATNSVPKTSNSSTTLGVGWIPALTYQPSGDYRPVFNATQAIDWSNGATQEITLTGSITSITFSHWTNGQAYRLILIQGGSGSYTVSGGGWASVKWAGAAAPTLTATVGHADVVTFVYANSIIYGAATLNFN
jgi:hypothetical protein